jgi:dinuclear metal center YbgI/SA1388 family protein
MLTINKLYSLLDGVAPFEISKEIIRAGGYDNSGILLNLHQNVEKVAFSLDFSMQAVEFAIKNKCDTIITHHPAIYSPISAIDVMEPLSSALVKAVEKGINVISMHLNLDEAKNGIDHYLAVAIGASDAKILSKDYLEFGYGREFCLNATTLKGLVARLKRELNSNKIVFYGKPNQTFNKVASFCGGGSSHAVKAVCSGQTDAEVIVTSDTPHHVIKELVERGKAVVLPTHYSAENYGFKKFYEGVTQSLTGLAQTYFFEDKRFL